MQTPASLLERLRNPGDASSWDRFVELYTPLLYSWARRAGLQSNEAADLVQDVFVVLLRKLPDFTYDRHKSFRAWLLTVIRNKWRENHRRNGGAARVANALPDDVPAPDDGDQTRSHRHHLPGGSGSWRAVFGDGVPRRRKP